jgi:hypothetical protein
LEHQFDYGLWDHVPVGAVRRNVAEGRFSDNPQEVETADVQTTPKPRATATPDDQSLKEDLLANDSLGG